MKYPIVLLLSALTVPAIAASTDWPSALHGIASGDANWIAQAPSLAAMADVRQAQLLEDALAAALTTNTSATLKALRIIDAGKWPHMVGSDIVCTPPLEKSPTEIDAFYHQTRRALLETVEGAQCLWILEATMEELKAEKARQAK
ncbi:hypothetical protein R3J08_001876 [Enterobacter hormaechei]|uniref:hypothetical protein n=1 Tax=Enterobacter cloacae complex TaxID=354276 RepID=UPI000650363B|nr:MULTISPECIES: hypothetical protein [Enterobacter cloacae complex]EHN8812618.1 hypothetical protein [Enterobacter hormaechei]EHN8821900.1 hypothetical protein [Enterobacter hormaechei]ELR0679479.1 hypothetical protein [Enterobacter hormaechei]MBN4785417.1 hypothetical protein [Enterobacter hormaechei]MCE1479097.1 hypothetical protein [Enterobacter hormaechei]